MTDTELTTCATPGCGTRTLPHLAASLWRDGRCTLCQNPEDGAEVRAAIRRGRRQCAAMREAGRC